MGTYYSPLFGEINPGSRVVHPTTGEVYGGTDWSNPEKLAECQALPMTEDAGDVPENPVQIGSEITLAVDELSYIKTKQWRSKTQSELDGEHATALSGALARVNAAREQLLESLTVEMGGMVFDADDTGRKNISGVLTALASGISIGDSLLWRDSYNVNRELSLEQLVMLGGLMLLAVQQLFEKSWVIKDEVLGSVTSELSTSELNAFDALAAFDSIT